ncbi:MAG: dihydrofolate reductase, partial [Bacteroidales bacterium]|nr:dihydrofolate reductase [Bacteroidales bacterium]
MKKIVKIVSIAAAAAAMSSCAPKQDAEFKYLIDEFADLKVMRYQVPGWDELSLQQKEYIYHLAEAAKWGRDIHWDQNCQWNIPVRKTLENIIENYKGDRECQAWNDFMVYAKRVFFSNGIHHHYAEDKFFPDCDKEYFQSLMEAVGEADNCETILKVVYDPEYLLQRKSTNSAGDIVAEPAGHYYEGATREEVEKFYADMADPDDKTPISYGLNSRVVKKDGVVMEEVWKVGGVY